jgi:hypothetical protein
MIFLKDPYYHEIARYARGPDRNTRMKPRTTRMTNADRYLPRSIIDRVKQMAEEKRRCSGEGEAAKPAPKAERLDGGCILIHLDRNRHAQT